MISTRSNYSKTVMKSSAIMTHTNFIQSAICHVDAVSVFLVNERVSAPHK